MAPPNPIKCDQCDFTTAVGLPTYDLIMRHLEQHGRVAHPQGYAGQAGAGQGQGGGGGKQEKLPRPALDTGITEADWTFFESQWKRYKRSTRLLGQDAIDQLWACASEELGRQCHDAGITENTTEDDLLATFKQCSIRAQNKLVNVVELLDITQAPEEPASKNKRTRKQNDDTLLPGKKIKTLANVKLPEKNQPPTIPAIIDRKKRKYIRKENKQQEKIKNVDSSLKTTTSVTISVPEKMKRKYTRKVKDITEKSSVPQERENTKRDDEAKLPVKKLETVQEGVKNNKITLKNTTDYEIKNEPSETNVWKCNEALKFIENSKDLNSNIILQRVKNILNPMKYQYGEYLEEEDTIKIKLVPVSVKNEPFINAEPIAPVTAESEDDNPSPISSKTKVNSPMIERMEESEDDPEAFDKEVEAVSLDAGEDELVKVEGKEGKVKKELKEVRVKKPRFYPCGLCSRCLSKNCGSCEPCKNRRKQKRVCNSRTCGNRVTKAEKDAMKVWQRRVREGKGVKKSPPIIINNYAFNRTRCHRCEGCKMKKAKKFCKTCSECIDFKYAPDVKKHRVPTCHRCSSSPNTL